MAFLEINPAYREVLGAAGLKSISDFLALNGPVVSGHPDRHVCKLVLASGFAPFGVFLKREHRVPWPDRVASFCGGFGLVSRAAREGAVLRDLANAGVGCPDWLAFGEDNSGHAFLLIREVADARALTRHLHLATMSAGGRRKLIGNLAEAVAAMHAAGFFHPDLFSKHVLVGDDGDQFYFLDWQRSWRWRRRSWNRRLRDLASLSATLPGSLASRCDRLMFLRAYMQATKETWLAPLAASGDARWAVPTRKWPKEAAAVAMIERETARLLKRRRIQDQRTIPTKTDNPCLIWLDGEALCVTPEFLASVMGKVPSVIRKACQASDAPKARTQPILLPSGRTAILYRHNCSRPLAWLWASLRGHALTSPLIEEAGRLFRCRLLGLPAPRVLALGIRHKGPWRTASFLLVDAEPDSAANPASQYTHADALGMRDERPLLEVAAGE
jgi:tRNA A-37 threonylcarbamoyl transferase component Bud32